MRLFVHKLFEHFYATLFAHMSYFVVDVFKIEIILVVADSVYEACDVKYIRSHIFECIVAENCQRVCSLCKKRR